MKKSHFEHKESYKHKYAVEVLKEWLTDYWRIDVERKFCIGGIIWFVPDLACNGENGICDFYEVVHKNSVSQFKLWRMDLFFKLHKWDGINVYQVSAEWIMNQIKKPDIMKWELIYQN